MTAIEHLDQAIKVACPNVRGVSIGQWSNKQSWRVFGAVTPAEQSQAQAIFQAFDKAAFDASQPSTKTREQILADIDAASNIAQLKAAVRAML